MSKKKTGSKVCSSKGCSESDLAKFSKNKNSYMGVQSKCKICTSEINLQKARTLGVKPIDKNRLKICSGCGESDLSMFGICDNGGYKGLKNKCRKCFREYDTLRRVENGITPLDRNRSKACTGCGEMDEACFGKVSKGYKGLNSKCKMCVNIKSKEYREKNPHASRDWHRNNPNYEKEWRNNNSDRKKLSNSEWKKVNRDKVTCYTTKSNATKLRAIPKNVDWGKIGRFYTDCSKLERYNVDHIIPLQAILPDGKRVAGAHYHTNLQLMLGVENSGKNNRVTYEDLDKATEGVDYIHVPEDYFETIKDNKYPNIGFDVIEEKNEILDELGFVL